MAVICNGMKNPRRSEVARDITSAILKSKADGKICATYWGQEEQEKQLQRVYDKWSEVGTVWSAAAYKVSFNCLEYRPSQLTRVHP
jgi:hypothetical protein